VTAPGRPYARSVRAWVVHKPGPMATGPLQLTERPVPEPGSGQLLLKIR
jgi:propanol-preferring alcohol dehydrogenase